MSKPRVYFGFRSPYSRLGLHVIAREGLDVDLIPFSGPPDGEPFADPFDYPAKLEYYRQDVPRATMRMGLPIKAPDPFDVDYGPANWAFIMADREGKGLALAVTLSDARWGEGKNISDPAVISDCLSAVDCKVDLSHIDDSEVDTALAHHRTLINQDRVFGVPFGVVGDQKFWGHDRFDILCETVKGA